MNVDEPAGHSIDCGRNNRAHGLHMVDAVPPDPVVVSPAPLQRPTPGQRNM